MFKIYIAIRKILSYGKPPSIMSWMKLWAMFEFQKVNRRLNVFKLAKMTERSCQKEHACQIGEKAMANIKDFE